MNLTEPKKIVYTAQSSNFFFARMLICKFVLESDYIPLNPFNVWGYFLYDLTDRDLVKRGNNNIVRITDETWVFGEISDGVYFEINYAMELEKPLRFFTLGKKFEDIREIKVDEIKFDSELKTNVSQVELIKKLQNYISTGYKIN